MPTLRSSVARRPLNPPRPTPYTHRPSTALGVHPVVQPSDAHPSGRTRAAALLCPYSPSSYPTVHPPPFILSAPIVSPTRRLAPSPTHNPSMPFTPPMEGLSRDTSSALRRSRPHNSLFIRCCFLSIPCYTARLNIRLDSPLFPCPPQWPPSHRSACGCVVLDRDPP